jgi:hypothetical protein
VSQAMPSSLRRSSTGSVALMPTSVSLEMWASNLWPDGFLYHAARRLATDLRCRLRPQDPSAVTAMRMPRPRRLPHCFSHPRNQRPAGRAWAFSRPGGGRRRASTGTAGTGRRRGRAIDPDWNAHARQIWRSTPEYSRSASRGRGRRARPRQQHPRPSAPRAPCQRIVGDDVAPSDAAFRHFGAPGPPGHVPDFTHCSGGWDNRKMGPAIGARGSACVTL